MGLDAATESLRWGVNDLGGTLMEESISRMAGSQHGAPPRARGADRRGPRGRPHAGPAHDALRHRRDLLSLRRRVAAEEDPARRDHGEREGEHGDDRAEDAVGGENAACREDDPVGERLRDRRERRESGDRRGKRAVPVAGDRDRGREGGERGGSRAGDEQPEVVDRPGDVGIGIARAECGRRRRGESDEQQGGSDQPDPNAIEARRPLPPSAAAIAPRRLPRNQMKKKRPSPTIVTPIWIRVR